ARGDAEHERAEGRRRAAEHGLGQGDGEPRQDDAPEGVEHGRKDGRSRQEPGAAALLNREAREQASLDETPEYQLGGDREREESEELGPPERGQRDGRRPQPAGGAADHGEGRDGAPAEAGEGPDP